MPNSIEIGAYASLTFGYLAARWLRDINKGDGKRRDRQDGRWTRCQRQLFGRNDAPRYLVNKGMRVSRI